MLGIPETTRILKNCVAVCGVGCVESVTCIVNVNMSFKSWSMGVPVMTPVLGSSANTVGNLPLPGTICQV
jgi:hypothetical protein